MDSEEWWNKREGAFPKAAGEYLDSIPRVSYYEARFFKLVLARLPGDDFDFDFEYLDHQRHNRFDGREQYVDFAIEEPDGSKIAIEVDGYEKSGGPPTYQEFTDSLNRQNGLVLSGWTVVRFSNDYMSKNPSQCVVHLRRLVKQDRDLAGGQKRLRSRNTQLEARLVQAEGEMHAQVRKLEQQRQKYEALKSNHEEEFSRLAEQKNRAQDRERAELEKQMAKLEGAFETTQKELLEAQQAVEAKAYEVDVLKQRVVASGAGASADEIAVQAEQMEEFEAQRRGSDELTRGLEADVQRRLKVSEGRVTRAEKTIAALEWRERMIKLVVLGFVGFGAALVLAAILFATSRGGDHETAAQPGVIASTATPPVAGTPRAVTLQSLVSPVLAGNDASIRLLVSARAQCSIEYITPAGTRSGAEGLVDRIADEQGNISWKWTIGSGTAPGQGTVRINCLAHSPGEWKFEIKKP